MGVFNEFPIKQQPKYWRGYEDQLHELSGEARQYQESAVGSRSLLDIPWSYEFWCERRLLLVRVCTWRTWVIHGRLLYPSSDHVTSSIARVTSRAGVLGSVYDTP